MRPTCRWHFSFRCWHPIAILGLWPNSACALALGRPSSVIWKGPLKIGIYRLPAGQSSGHLALAAFALAVWLLDRTGPSFPRLSNNTPPGKEALSLSRSKLPTGLLGTKWASHTPAAQSESDRHSGMPAACPVRLLLGPPRCQGRTQGEPPRVTPPVWPRGAARGIVVMAGLLPLLANWGPCVAITDSSNSPQSQGLVEPSSQRPMASPLYTYGVPPSPKSLSEYHNIHTGVVLSAVLPPYLGVKLFGYRALMHTWPTISIMTRWQRQLLIPV